MVKLDSRDGSVISQREWWSRRRQVRAMMQTADMEPARSDLVAISHGRCSTVRRPAAGEDERRNPGQYGARHFATVKLSLAAAGVSSPWTLVVWLVQLLPPPRRGDW